MLAWPSISWMMRMSTPSASNRHAPSWRRSCQRRSMRRSASWFSLMPQHRGSGRQTVVDISRYPAAPALAFRCYDVPRNMSLRQWLHGLSTRPTDETVQSLRQGWLRHHLEILRQDLHYHLRVIRRSGPLSGAVVLTLLVGLGMNSVVFSVLNGLLFRSSATRDPHTFVQVYAQPSGQSRRELHGPETMVTLEDFHAIRSATRTLSAVTVSRWASFTLGAADEVPLRGKFVSCNFVSAHIGPLKVGRGLAESDCSARGGEPVVVLTERAWNLH